MTQTDISNARPTLNTSHWTYFHGAPICQATFKQHAEDFIVTENLGFEPSGAGEHVFLWLEKQNLNTAFVAEALAKFSGLPLRDVTYAGRKDKFALTRQWFGLYMANKPHPDWDKFTLDGAKILSQTKNDRKLRTGALQGNHFDITLRDIDTRYHAELEQRLSAIKTQGAPNYYGEQRFGQIRSDEPNSLGGNLALALKMIEGENIRNRNKRSMAISALRSWLFNEFIHRRIGALGFNTLHVGDVMQLVGSNSFFLAEEIDERLIQRQQKRDINITCPLWGKGFGHSSDDIANFENTLAAENKVVCDALAALGLKQERRAMVLYADNLTWAFEQQTLKLSFDLPSGCFATSILREMLDLNQ